MKKAFKITTISLFLLGIVAASIYFITVNDVIVLNPKGMIGAKERDLIITSSLLMIIVVVPVMLFTLIFAWRYREGKGKGRHDPEWSHSYIAEYCWWGVPLIIILILAILCWRSTHELNPFRPIESDKKSVKIQAVALNWKWLFLYPEEGIATVNYIRFPEKTPIDFEITADAPMNSFWIPQLGGMIYAMPSMRSQLHLIADEPGIYQGTSSNISGKGFAGMTFKAEATSDAQYKSWIQGVRNRGKPLGMAQYNELVEPSEYVPPAFYALSDKDLFYKIIQKYRTPQKSEAK